MIRLKLLIAALIGSYLSWILIDNLIVPISILQYLGIELVVIVFHGFYNYLRDGIKAEK